MKGIKKEDVGLWDKVFTDAKDIVAASQTLASVVSQLTPEYNFHLPVLTSQAKREAKREAKSEVKSEAKREAKSKVNKYTQKRSGHRDWVSRDSSLIHFYRHQRPQVGTQSQKKRDRQERDNREDRSEAVPERPSKKKKVRRYSFRFQFLLIVQWHGTGYLRCPHSEN